MRKILTTALLAITAMNICADNNYYIYRNNGQFHHLRSKERIEIGHSIAADGSAVLNIPGMEAADIMTVDSCTMRTADIPILNFRFPDYPDATMLWDKELYLKTELDVEGNGMTDDQYGLTLKVKGRGNSTWLMDKKPMRLKFEKKTSICGFKKSKNYALLANHLDNTLLRNNMAMWLAQQLNVPYANHIVPCHVYVNGHYNGAYTLTEKVGINGSSVDIDENTGVLIELSTDYDETYKFRSMIYNMPVMIKDPDFDELAEEGGMSASERLQLWKDDFFVAENLAKMGKGSQAFDVESFVNYVLLFEITGNNELGHPKSVYLHKTSPGRENKWVFGPAWDFDVAFNYITNKPEVGFIDASPTTTMRLNELLLDLFNTPEFKARYIERFNEFLTDIYPQYLQHFDEMAILINPAAHENGMRWPDEKNIGWTLITPSSETQTRIPNMRKWMIDRVEYMKSKYGVK